MVAGQSLPNGEYIICLILFCFYVLWALQILVSFLLWLYRTNDYICQLDRVVELQLNRSRSRITMMVSGHLTRLFANNPSAISMVSGGSGKAGDLCVRVPEPRCSVSSQGRLLRDSLTNGVTVSRQKGGRSNRRLDHDPSLTQRRMSNLFDMLDSIITRDSITSIHAHESAAPVSGKDLQAANAAASQSDKVLNVVAADMEGKPLQAAETAEKVGVSSPPVESSDSESGPTIIVGTVSVLGGGATSSNSSGSLRGDCGVMLVCNQRLLDSTSGGELSDSDSQQQEGSH